MKNIFFLTYVFILIFTSCQKEDDIPVRFCVLSYPTIKTPGKFYFKMSDDNTVYEYIENTQKFVQVKVQRLTPKSEKVLELASYGKTQ